MVLGLLFWTWDDSHSLSLMDGIMESRGHGGVMELEGGLEGGMDGDMKGDMKDVVRGGSEVILTL